MQRYENIDKKLNSELQKIDKKLENDSGDMSAQEIELVDCVFHALKSAEGYYAMAEEKEMGFSGNYGSGGSYGMGSGNSYARGRDSRGRYASREMSREGGYSGGYSGRYPMMPYYSGEYEGGRW